MPFFSRLMKTKKDADQEKKVTEQAAVAVETKPKPEPLKQLPVDAVQDAHPATLTRRSTQETRPRIADARNRKSQRSATAPITAYHSRPKSEFSFPISSITRSKSDLSIATMMGQSQNPRLSSPINYYSSPIPPVPPIPLQHRPKPLDEHHTFSTPRDAPQPPLLIQSPSHSQHSENSVPSTPRASSPLSKTPVEDEPETMYSNSSKSSSDPADSPSASSNESPQSQSGSGHARSDSRQSRSDSRRDRNGSTRQRSKSRFRVPTLPSLSFSIHSNRPSSMEISLPYGTNEDVAEKRATNTMPAWRYEDLSMETDAPVFVDSISHAHSRNSSISRSIFLRRNSSFSVMAF